MDKKLQLLLGVGQMAGQEIGDLVRKFAVEKGLVQQAGGAIRELGEAAIKPAAKSAQYLQGELLTKAGQAQRFAKGSPFIRATPVEEAYKVARPIAQSVADIPATRVPARVAPGQMTLGAAPVPQFKTTQIQGPVSPEALRLFETSPGEYNAIRELADRASAYYGKPVTVSDLVAGGSGGGTNLLRNLETDLRRATSMVPSPGGAMRPPVAPGALEAMQPGGALAESSRGALINAILNKGRGVENIVDVDVRDVTRGIGGLRQVDLSKLGAAAGLLGAGAIGFGLGRMGGTTTPAAPELPGPMGPTTANPEVGLASDPQVAQQQQMTAAQAIAASMAPSARAVIPEATYTGAGGQPIMTTRGEDEALTSAKQQYAKPQKGISKYYAEREAYAKYPAYKAEIISELQKRGVLDTPELLTWAGANPTLAYELLRKATGSNTLPSQQVPQPTQVTTTTSMGSNTMNNMIGNSAYLSESLIGGKAGASDLAGVTTATTNLEINPIPTDIIGRLQQSVLLGR